MNLSLSNVLHFTFVRNVTAQKCRFFCTLLRVCCNDSISISIVYSFINYQSISYFTLQIYYIFFIKLKEMKHEEKYYIDLLIFVSFIYPLEIYLSLVSLQIP